MIKVLKNIIICCIISIILVIILKNNTESIYVDIVNPSNAKVVFNSILGDSVEIKRGNFITIDINSDLDEYKIIDTNNLLKIENNRISAENIGKTEIYVISLDEKIKSNIYTINVIE
ncbi:MAG: hypothetical protein IJO32_03625 [Bacilli bacterium]|nr:hypothetical protein [Bacilli bacterium]